MYMHTHYVLLTNILTNLSTLNQQQPGNKPKMAKNLILGYSYLNLCPLFLAYVYVCMFTCFSFCCISYAQVQDGGAGPYSTFTISSFTYARTVLKPFDWRYIRVDLPPWFASVSIALESDVDLDLKTIRRPPKSTLPMICFREGSPPLPDIHNTSLNGLVLGGIVNGSFGVLQNLQIVGQCYPMQRNMSVTLTNEEIPPGVWYIGLFNGFGPMRTQSKMINRGSAHSFSGSVSVEGCTTSMMLGQFCDQTVDLLSCIDNYNLTKSGFNNKSHNPMAENVIACRNADEKVCHGDDGPKLYSLDMVAITEKLIIAASDVRSNETQSSNNSSSMTGIILMGYARHGAMPSKLLHDYSGNINEDRLVIEAPRLGRWYIAVEVVNLTEKTGQVQDRSTNVCYSLEWQVVQCPVDKAGLNCTGERYALQTVLRKNPSVPFESYYLPISDKVSPDSANFPLEPLLSNVSSGRSGDVAWTFFHLDIPSGAAGGNMHIRLVSDAKIKYEIYAKYGGLPTLNSWDYFYTNSTSSSNGSMFFKLYDSSEKTISFYILYVREGTWSIGLWHPTATTPSATLTTMSISLERCPQKCSSHGSCQSVVDTSGLTLYSYCSCDRNHGGFDCSVELVSHRGKILKTHVGHIWQSVSLIASNAAAVLPAYWALRHKAFAEWVLFTSSGISSGLYHACDVGTWCPLTFRVLQFMDFWLSFMAVVSTFVYLTTIDEISKRTIHTVVAILTALMAETGPTRSSNIVLVIAIGAAGLLVGWFIEFCTHYRSFTFPSEFRLNFLDRWESFKGWICNLIKMIIRRFRWVFMLAGFAALAMAAISWKLETGESYWIWHSMWHVSIYTSSFLFLCSKANAGDCENGRPAEVNYELTRTNSFTNGEQGGQR